MVHKFNFERDPPPKKKGMGKVHFLALQPTIEAALIKGWCVRDIWQELFNKKHIFIQYRLFSQYVKTLILQEKIPAHGKEREEEYPPPPALESETTSSEGPPVVIAVRTQQSVRPSKAVDVSDNEIY